MVIHVRSSSRAVHIALLKQCLNVIVTHGRVLRQFCNVHRMQRARMQHLATFRHTDSNSTTVTTENVHIKQS